MINCGCEGDTLRAGTDRAYRRRLWIAVILDIGFGLLELVRALIANSQVLKSDSVDFIGDRSITLVRLIARLFLDSAYHITRNARRVFAEHGRRALT